MVNTLETHVWQPISKSRRYPALDALRGLALLGVLMVNLHCDFRISLAQHILTFHGSPDWADCATDILVAALLEFKAFALFSWLFGIGIALFAERAAARGVGATRFLIRRLLVLFALGLCHLLLIWNGDILTLYAICGALLLPFLRLPVVALASAGGALVILTFVIPWGFLWPTDEVLRALATEAARVYSDGSFGAVVAFHWWETRLLVLPLLIFSLPKTLGLMALGAAAWRAGMVRDAEQHRRMLWGVALGGTVVGGSMTGISVYSASTGRSVEVPAILVETGSTVPLALAYAAALLLALRSSSARVVLGPFAAAGQMALTNYLSQSVILSFLFYGYGLGLFGRLGSAAAALLGLTLYAGQLAFSVWWLRRYRFGPLEWLWRSLTYGRWQPMRLAKGDSLEAG